MNKSNHSVFYSGIGSRKTPEHVLERMRNLGRILCDRGWRGRSGLAPGADSAFYEGARQSKRFEEIGFDNYLPNSWLFNREEYGFIKPDPSRRIFDAQKFPNYNKARELAEQARGSFHGLGRGGIELHSRNPYQVLGHELITPSKAVIFYAVPINSKGPNDRCRVKGGTNTAVQIAYRYNIETINLYWPEQMERIDRFITQTDSGASP